MQYLKEIVKDEVNFLPADKHHRFLQSDNIILGVCGQACPNYPKQQVCYFFAISEEVSDEVDFLYADKHENFIQTDAMILMGMTKYSQSF